MITTSSLLRRSTAPPRRLSVRRVGMAPSPGAGGTRTPTAERPGMGHVAHWPRTRGGMLIAETASATNGEENLLVAGGWRMLEACREKAVTGLVSLREATFPPSVTRGR